MEKQINLGSDKVNKIFWQYAIPSIIAMLAQTTASLIDSIFIGKFIGPEGLSAITLFFPFIMILIGLGAMFAIGSSTLAGIELGKGRQEKSNNYFNLAVWVITFISIISSILIISNMHLITNALNVSGITKQYILDYGSTISGFYIFFMLNFVLSFFLKLDGKPSLVVKVMLLGTVTNIILDYIFIVHLDLSLKGAALATGMSQLLPWLIFIGITIKSSNWSFRKPVFIKSEIQAIFFNGSSEFLSNTAHAITGIVFNFIILNRLGVLGVAAYAVALQIASVAGSLGYGFGEANQSGISYNMGSRQLERVNAFRNLTLKATLITGILLFLVTFFFGDVAAKIFIKDAETVKLSAYILKFYAFGFIVMCTNVSVGTYYTAVNDPVISGGITFYRSLIGLMIGLLIFPIIMGDDGIWYATLFAEYTTFIASMILYKVKPFGLNSEEKKPLKKIA